jgi:hypothetical protein
VKGSGLNSAIEWQELSEGRSSIGEFGRQASDHSREKKRRKRKEKKRKRDKMERKLMRKILR